MNTDRQPIKKRSGEGLEKAPLLTKHPEGGVTNTVRLISIIYDGKLQNVFKNIETGLGFVFRPEGSRSEHLLNW